MDLKEIKQVVELMKSCDLAEFEIEEEGLKLRIKRGTGDAEPRIVSVAPAPVAAAPAAAAAAAAPAGAPAAADEVGVEVIKSPMVGTFYRSPSPDSPVFVDKGSEVRADTVICIVEAMKVMNEIQAEISGTIVEVLVDNETAVEFGQPLFKVKKS